MLFQWIKSAVRMKCISCTKEGANPKTGLCGSCSF